MKNQEIIETHAEETHVIPANTISLDTKVALKPTKNDIPSFPSSLIIVDESLNIREEDNYGDIDELAESIRAHGVLVPLKGYKETGDDGITRFVATHGLRRNRALKKLLAEGLEIMVPCISKKKSEFTKERIVIEHFTMNTGKPLSVLEKANGIKILSNYGYAVPQIARELSMTEANVYNLLQLSTAPMMVKNSISQGEISASTALEIIRENSSDIEKASDIIVRAVESAKSSGKTKATKKDLIASGGSKKASEKEDKKKKVFELIRDISHKYNVDESERVELERAIREILK